MSGNLVQNTIWTTVNKQKSIEQPFQSYLTPYSRHFADWLLGLTSDPEYDKRFGHKFNDSGRNLIQDILEVTNVQLNEHEKIGFTKIEDKKALEKLKTIRDKLRAQADELYTLTIGEKNFEKFCEKWSGQNIGEQDFSQEDENLYWINKNLKLLTGQTQRLATGKSNTLIEQLLELLAIELEINGIEFSRENIQQIKQELNKQGELTILNKQYKKKKKKSKSFIYIPTDSKTQTNDLLEILEKYLTQEGRQYIDMMTNKINDIKKLNEALNQGKEVRNLFVNIKRSQRKIGNDYINKITERVSVFLKIARDFAFSEDEKKRWNEYYQEENKESFDKSIHDLCEDFFSTDVEHRNYYKINNESMIMGFLGELYTHGKFYFNIKNENMKIYNTGFLKDNINHQSLQQDTIIVITDENQQKHRYGVQTKNPYTLDKGLYTTYKTSYKLSNKKLYQYYITGQSDDFKNMFELINLNLTNTSNAKLLQQTIEHFLYNFADNLMRLSMQEIDGLENLDEEISENLEGKTQNVFFVVNGTLIETASFLDGLIFQLENLQEDINKKESILKITYSNTIKRNTKSKNQIARAAEELEQGYYEYIDKFVKYNLLSKVSINSVMNIRIKPLQDVKTYKL